MNKITRTMLIFLIALGLILSACAGSGASVDLKGTSWKLVSYGPLGNQTPAAAGITTSLDFGNDGTVSGNMGCNSFGGNFELKNGKLVFSQMISTMMACLGPQMAQEDGCPEGHERHSEFPGVWQYADNFRCQRRQCHYSIKVK